MNVLDGLLYGISLSASPVNLAYCFVGCLIGTIIGILPGLGPVTTMSLLLPMTLHVSPVSSLIMLAGIYYGAQYGGSTTSILINIPGEASSVMTCMDGYEMAKQGRAGAALGMAAFGSFIAGTVGVLGLMLIAPPLSNVAIKFGPAEYFSLMILGLTMVAFLGGGSMVKAVAMAVLGLILSMVGIDPMGGLPRFTFGITNLEDGFDLVAVLTGLFGLSEVFYNIEYPAKQELLKTKIKGLFPTLNDWVKVKWSILRGTIVGFFLGILPGGGAIIASFAAYAVEKKCSKHPEEFGKGAIEGVAAPESANNAAAQTSFIPLMTLGLPSNVVMAVLLGAMMMHGLKPGPLLMSEHPEIFWGVMVSMYIGNIMLLILNLPLIPLWVKFLKVPYHIMAILILIFCIIGSYTINNQVFNIYEMGLFGILGYFMRKYQYEAAPLVLALVLGPLLENGWRQSLIISDGNVSIFFTHPISASLLGAAFLMVILKVYQARKSPGLSQVVQ
jgi:putative tricarboxylic transport membrane protein